MRHLIIFSALALSSSAFAVQFLATDGTKLFRANDTGTVQSPITLSAAIQSLTQLPTGYSLAGASPGDIIALGTTAVSSRYKMYRVDNPFGAAALVEIGSLNHGIGSLVFANGKMWGIEDSLAPLRIYDINMVTGDSTTTYTTTINVAGGGGLAFNSANGLFYFTDATNHRLYSWAPGGSATLVGPTGFAFSNNGIEFYNGTLYGAARSDTSSTTMRFGRFDITTGAFTTLATATGITGGGTGFVAVPEPGTVAGLLASLLVLRRRRR